MDKTFTKKTLDQLRGFFFRMLTDDKVIFDLTFIRAKDCTEYCVTFDASRMLGYVIDEQITEGDPSSCYTVGPLPDSLPESINYLVDCVVETIQKSDTPYPF